MRKEKTLITIGILLIIGIILPYFFVFRSGFSINSQDWGDFGKYLSGLAAIINVFVFMAITLLIHKLNTKNKNFELRFNNNKEIFSRFLNSYEKLIEKLYSLKVYLAQNKVSNQDIEIEKLLVLFETIKSLEALSKTYIPDKNIAIDLELFIEKFCELIGICSNGAMLNNMALNAQIKLTIKEIDNLIENLSSEISTHLHKPIDNNYE
jgi:hypothetical protein